MADEKDPTKMTATEANAAAPSSGNSAPAKAAKRTLLDALKNGESLYTLRFKGIRGMQEVNILASSAEKAEQVGRAWVNLQPGRLYISVHPALVADESILAQVNQPDAVGAGAVGKR